MTQQVPLRRTPLYDQHLALSARMVPFGGWEMPLSYAGQLAEHEAVRTKVGVFDVSHMGQFRIEGPDAADFLECTVPGLIASLAAGQSRYTQLVQEDGGTIDDLIISRLGPTTFFAVVNASRREADWNWLTMQAAKSGADVQLADESDDWIMLAVQGPAALELAARLLPGTAWDATPAFTLHEVSLHGCSALLSRTGYSGEIGFELLYPVTLGSGPWQELLSMDAVPCGLAARDSLRLEAGYCLYGHELSASISPIEASVGWSVPAMKTTQYPGSTILLDHKKNGAGRVLIGVRGEGRRPLRDGEEIVLAGTGELVGAITSGGFSPGLQCGIGLALVLHDAAAQPLQLRSKGREYPIATVKPPFVETSLSRRKKT